MDGQTERWKQRIGGSKRRSDGGRQRSKERDTEGGREGGKEGWREGGAGNRTMMNVFMGVG